MKYIATFFSHFGAIRFEKNCRAKNVPAKLMPVPRTLSSSCGTCVSYESNDYLDGACITSEVEQIVEVIDDGYRECYRAENS